MRTRRLDRSSVEILLIGGSAGSLKVLLQILPHLNDGLAFPIILILHRKADAESVLDELLANHTTLNVFEIEDKTVLETGNIYLVPSDYHVLFENKRVVSLDCSEKLNYSRPSIDVVFQSAAQVFEDGAAALLLSGANADGVEGLVCVHERQGLVLVQDPSTAEVDYMPRQALQNVWADYILKPKEMAIFINQLGKEAHDN
ncbi:chemotaxis protein CheB [Sphingobacterium suaedae]|uniref:protein-glutamate methylesterase n=1 Tax=Sphingobacterium suaedae TaxID=1686402 RepID=A0ABW5KCV2_9SPHI